MAVTQRVVCLFDQMSAVPSRVILAYSFKKNIEFDNEPGYNIARNVKNITKYSSFTTAKTGFVVYIVI